MLAVREWEKYKKEQFKKKNVIRNSELEKYR